MQYLVMGILAGIAGLLILVSCIKLFCSEEYTIGAKLGIGIVGIVMCAGFFVFSSVGIKVYFSPHHAMKPTIYDVPMEAHIDTVTTIINGDTTRHCIINWNNKEEPSNE